MEPIINSQLPEFKVQAFQNGNFKTVTNEDVLGKWAIFFFYPADFTFVCPTELVDMAEKYEQFKSMGVEIYSVSTDSHFVHKAWHDASETIRKIQYPMLADPTGALSRAFGVMIEEGGYGIPWHFLGKSGRKESKWPRFMITISVVTLPSYFVKLKPLSLSLHMMVRFVPLNGRKGRLP